MKYQQLTKLSLVAFGLNQGCTPVGLDQEVPWQSASHCATAGLLRVRELLHQQSQ
jgi:hypothetical protein